MPNQLYFHFLFSCAALSSPLLLQHNHIQYRGRGCLHASSTTPVLNVIMQQQQQGTSRRTRKAYPCTECDYAATTFRGLKEHKESMHDCIRYPCTECDYAATTAGDLKTHKEGKHKGIRYSCTECNYTRTTAGNLKIHKESNAYFTCVPLNP